MNPLGTRSRVEELARLLEGAVSGPTTLTAGHAALAVRLRAVAPALDARAVPRADFRTALRTRLVAVATVQAAALADAPAATARTLDAAVTWTQTRKAQRRIGATAGAMAGVIALTGVGIAASRSLPGQPFYGLKTGAEGLQLDLAHGDTAKGSKHLEFAATRLREVRALAHGDGELSLGGAHGTPLAGGVVFASSTQQRINETLSAFNNETSSGRTLLEHAYRATGKQAPLRILKSFSTVQHAALVAILPQLPAASRRSATSSLNLVTEVGDTATQLLDLGTCGPDCLPQAGGPTLPTEPVPTPGVTAQPSPADNNQVPGCSCVQPTTAPEPTDPPVDPTEAPTTEPTATTEPTPTTTPSPSSSPSPGLLPFPLPIPLPTHLLPTSIPLPPLPLLPTELPLTIPTSVPDLLSLIPTLAPFPKS